jgi:enterochelin esterase-like enzyme
VGGAQQVQPADARADRRDDGDPTGHARQEAQAEVKALLALLALVWAAVGVHGLVSYGDSYVTYRGFPPPKDPPGVAHGTLVHERFYSRALGGKRSYLVYEPPGYAREAARGRRFPVLYLLHGAPGHPSHFINVVRGGVVLDKGLHDHRLRPFLMVMPNGSNGTFRNDTEWANTSHGRYEDFAIEVIRSVDARFATRPERRFRAIAGDSEGGYGAMNIALHHLDLFATVESWSGYFFQLPQGVFKDAPPALLLANEPSYYVRSLGPRLHRYPLHAYIYKGTEENASGIVKARDFAVELRREGAHVTFRVFRGGHNWRLWRAQTPRMLAYASRMLGARG